MSQQFGPPGNVVLLRGACLWLLMALVLAWCMIGLAFQVPYMAEIFPGKFTRVLQGHIDFLLMTALILGIYATKTLLPWHVRWAMVVGAFTNSSLFVLQAMFPVLDSQSPPEGFFPTVFLVYLFASLILTSYGFGKAAVLVFKSTFASESTSDQGIAAKDGKGDQRGLADWSPGRVGATLKAAIRGPSTISAKIGVLRRRYFASVSASPGVDALLNWMIFTGLTVLAFFLLWFFGLAQTIVESDPTYISSIIALIYVATSAHCLWRAIAVSKEGRSVFQTSRLVSNQMSSALPDGVVASHIRELKTMALEQDGGRIDQTLMLRVLAERLRGSNGFGTFVSDMLMKLGLLGTIIGFIMMLAPISGLDPDDQGAIKSSMSSMSEGMAVAMYTTLTGLVGSVLVKVQYFLVQSSTSRIFSQAVALTEVHVIPTLEKQRRELS